MIVPYIITLLVIYVVLSIIIHNNLYNSNLFDTDKDYTTLYISQSKSNKQKHANILNTVIMIDKRSNSTDISKQLKSQSSKPYQMSNNTDSKYNTIPNHSTIDASMLVAAVPSSKLTTHPPPPSPPPTTPTPITNKKSSIIQHSTSSTTPSPTTTSSSYPPTIGVITPPLSLPRPTHPYIPNNIIFPDNKYYANNTCIYTHFEPIHQALIPPITPDPIYQIDAIYIVHYTLLRKRKVYMNKHVYDIFGVYPTFIEAFDMQALTTSSNSSTGSGSNSNNNNNNNNNNNSTRSRIGTSTHSSSSDSDKSTSILECFIEPGRAMQRKVLNNTFTYLG